MKTTDKGIIVTIRGKKYLAGRGGIAYHVIRIGTGLFWTIFGVVLLLLAGLTDCPYCGHILCVCP